MSRIARLPPIVVVLALAGCTRPPPISRNDAAAMIKGYQIDHCDPEEFSVRAANVGEDALISAEGWLNKDVLQDPQFRTLSRDTTHRTAETGVVSFEEGAQALRLDWTEIHDPEAEPDDRLTLRSCVFVAKKIKVFDVAPSRFETRARVLFSETVGYSLFGKRLAAAGLLAKYADFTPPSHVDDVASLARDASGGWQVDAVSPRY